MSLGSNIKELRTASNLTQAGLAQTINRRYDVKINKAMLSKWENNREVPHLLYVKYLALFFGVTLDYLLDLPSSSKAPISALMEQLNDEGQEKVVGYASDLIASGKYHKHDPSELGQKEA